MNQPLVSVCIGAYNRERYIAETLDSVFAQTYPNLEVIVVDDASTDRTVEIIERYGPRVRLIRRTQNSGMCPITRNQALRAATGSYVAFLDSDDAWYPEKIRRQVEFLEAHPDIPLCHTYCHLMDEQSRVTGIRHEGRVPPTGDCFIPLLRHCWVTISSIMIRRELPEQVGGGFCEDPRYGIWGEDYEFILRVARRYHLGLVDGVLTRYRRAAQNISSGNWRQTPESFPFHEWMLQRRDIWEGRVPRSTMVSTLVEIACTNAEWHRHRGRPTRALYFAARGLRYSPLSYPLLASMAKALVGPFWAAAKMTNTSIGKKIYRSEPTQRDRSPESD